MTFHLTPNESNESLGYGYYAICMRTTSLIHRCDIFRVLGKQERNILCGKTKIFLLVDCYQVGNLLRDFSVKLFIFFFFVSLIADALF
jgi:hypothetical protein